MSDLFVDATTGWEEKHSSEYGCCASNEGERWPSGVSLNSFLFFFFFEFADIGMTRDRELGP